MSGAMLMKCLLVVYLITGLVFLYEQNYAKAWYWFAATQITAAVLLMR